MPLLWLSVSFILGLIAANGLQLENWFFWMLLFTPFIVFALFENRLLSRLHFYPGWRKLIPIPITLLIAIFLLGAVRFTSYLPGSSPKDLAWYNDRGVYEIIGQVNSFPDYRSNYTQLVIEARKIASGFENQDDHGVHDIKGKLLARVPLGKTFEYGDVLRLEGSLQTPPESDTFSYRDYLAGKGIFSYLNYPHFQIISSDAGNPIISAIYKLRSAAHQKIKHLLPQPESSLLAGIILGIETDIPYDVKSAFNDTGTTHIIAISGFNIAIVTGMLIFLAGRLTANRWKALLAAIIGIILYTILVGAQPSVVRAAIMGSVGLLGRQLGRTQSGVNSLTFCGAVMAFTNPFILRDAGFQLSFAATLGLIVYAEPLQNWFINLAEKRISSETAARISKPVGEYLLFTLAAQITTLPIILYHFQRLSLSSLLANILILPAQPMIMILGGVSVLSALVLQPFGQFFAFICWPFIAYTIKSVEWVAKIPGMTISFNQFNFYWILIFYLVLFLLTSKNAGVMKLKSIIKPTMILVLLGVLAITLWQVVLTRPDGRLNLTIFDIENESAVFIQSPTGNTILINGGTSASQLSNHLGRRLSIIARELNAVIITNVSASSIQGLGDTLQRYPTQVLFLPEVVKPSKTLDRLISQVGSQGTEIHVYQQGYSIKIDDQCYFEVIDQVEGRTAIMLTWRNFSALIPGGFLVDPFSKTNLSIMKNSSLLVLGNDDLESQNIKNWSHLYPQVVFLPLPASGRDSWISYADKKWVTASSDGENIWITTGQ